MMQTDNLSSEELASRLMITVINYEENKDKLDDFPYIQKGSFAVLMQLCVGEKNDKGHYTVCLNITNSMLNKWGLEKNTLFEIAADNSKKLFPAMYQTVENYLDVEVYKSLPKISGEIDISNIIVLTNHMHFNGAATMFYDPDVLNDIAASLHSEKITMLPSSVNQIYCIPQRTNEEIQECQEIFKELVAASNREEALAKSILTYNARNGMITEMNGVSYGLNLNEAANRRMEHRR